jgi:hypothetical protein
MTDIYLTISLSIIARTPTALKEMFLTLDKEARYAVLIVNQSKTKYMKTARGKDKMTQQYIIEQNQFERVSEFTYLGTQINILTIGLFSGKSNGQ